MPLMPAYPPSGAITAKISVTISLLFAILNQLSIQIVHANRLYACGTFVCLTPGGGGELTY